MKALKFAIFLLCIGLTSNALAFQYEDFRWGQPLEKSLSIVYKNKKKPLDVTDNSFAYRDVILESPCKVELIFSQPNKMLHTVKLVWDSPAVGDKVKQALIEMHGYPVPSEEGEGRFVWFGASQDDALVLDYSANATELFYSADVASLQESDKPVSIGDTFK